MSRKYDRCADVPTSVIIKRLEQLSDAITKGREASEGELTMRIPAEPDRYADLVLSEAAKRRAKMTDTKTSEQVYKILGLEEDVKLRDERIEELERMLAARRDSEP